MLAGQFVCKLQTLRGTAISQSSQDASVAE
jgi:hypothetical protein